LDLYPTFALFLFINKTELPPKISATKIAAHKGANAQVVTGNAIAAVHKYMIITVRSFEFPAL
jgi:hypothetical protein